MFIDNDARRWGSPVSRDRQANAVKSRGLVDRHACNKARDERKRDPDFASVWLLGATPVLSWVLWTFQAIVFDRTPVTECPGTVS